MIIYGVLTELGNTADTETLQYVPYSCWDCHHLLLLFWKILKDFSFHCLVWIGVNRTVFPKGRVCATYNTISLGAVKIDVGTLLQIY